MEIRIEMHEKSAQGTLNKGNVFLSDKDITITVRNAVNKALEAHLEKADSFFITSLSVS